MKLQKCEMCGKTTTSLHEHHIIPWRFSHDDSESNIMKLCPTCHRRVDAKFLNFIVYGEMNARKATNKRVATRYIGKYCKRKILYSIVLLKRTYYHDVLDYNIRTGSICITHSWACLPNRHIGRSLANYINSRRKMVRAAAVKGQTTLSGGGIK